MAKRVRYKMGDIFMIPLEGDLKGVGRVLKKDEAAVFIEFYHIKPIKDPFEFSFSNALKQKPLIMMWCYDDVLRNGAWKIFDNKPINKEIDMPFFWKQDAGDKKYYIRKGSSDSCNTFGERIEISKEDIHKYEPSGIGNEISERNRYVRKLREVGLL